MFVVEVRPGEGGDDAAMFAEELAGAVMAFCRRRRWGYQRRDGGARMIVVEIDGDPGALEPIAGVHRIQRVPSNDRRRHTSTATLAVLEELSSRRVEVLAKDLVITAYRASGPGGQHRNKTATAVRIRHRPTGLVVSAEDSRSQHQNLVAATAKLAGELQAAAERRDRTVRARRRAEQIASAERPAKSFTHRQIGAHAQVVCHETGQRWRLADFAGGKI